MNAGAYGGEICQVLQEASVLGPDGELRRMTAEELGFGYRKSALQGGSSIVCRAVFRLEKRDSGAVREKIAELNRQRAEKQPLDVPSAGSTFKRPEGAFAAALIDQCGLKGYAVGDAMVSPKHAGFLVNTGTSSADFLTLMENVQRIVFEKTGYRLEPEIRILGEDSPGAGGRKAVN